MELELKHLAPYLPYGLKMAYRNSRGEYEPYSRLVSLYNYYFETHPHRVLIEGMNSEHIWMFKPMLKPLSEFGNSDDLRKLHEFIGLGNWCDAYDEYFKAWFNDASNIDKLVLQAPQEIFNYFLANHYDVFSLISQGLAIVDMPSLLS